MCDVFLCFVTFSLVVRHQVLDCVDSWSMSSSLRCEFAKTSLERQIETPDDVGLWPKCHIMFKRLGGLVPDAYL